MVSDGIRVLHVDDEESFLELSETFLEREDDTFDVRTVSSADAGLEYVRSNPVDCIVSDYDMPEIDGLEFLETVREEQADLPFILFTGKGSEEIASRAVSAGVTDYLQKKGRSDVFALLAQRVRNAVGGRRARDEAERNRRFLEKVLERATDVVAVVDAEQEVRYVSSGVERVTGYDGERIREVGPFDTIHPEDRAAVESHFARRLCHPEEPTGIGFRIVTPGGDVERMRARAYNLVDDPDVEGVLVFLRPDERSERSSAAER